jgi:hypothetical protein
MIPVNWQNSVESGFMQQAHKGTSLGDYCFEKGLVDMELFSSVSNERRQTTLKFPDEHKKRLEYYAENWDIMIYPFNLTIRLRRLLNTLRLLKTVRTIKRSVYGFFGKHY